jgi:hypothetical protein
MAEPMTLAVVYGAGHMPAVAHHLAAAARWGTISELINRAHLSGPPWTDLPHSIL